MFSLPVDDLRAVADRLRGLWPKQKKFFITGGTGFFGRWLIETVAVIEKEHSSGNTYTLISRQSREDLIKKIPVLSATCFEVIQQDLSTGCELSAKYDYVIHAASDVQAAKSGQDGFSDVIRSTENLLSAVENPDSVRFLYVSSGAVYLDQNRPNETSATVAPGAGSYGEAKRASEVLVEQKLKNFYLARCFSFIGPEASPQMAVMDMLRRKRETAEIQVRSPRVVRSFMYAADLTEILLRLLLQNPKNRCYNVGSDEALTLLQLAKKVDTLAPGGKVTVTTEAVTSLAGNIYVPDVSRIQDEFFPQRTNLDTALKKTFAHMNERLT